MKKQEKIYKELYSPITKGSKAFVEARKLDENDFKVKVFERAKEDIIKWIGHGIYTASIDVSLLLKSSTIKLLDELPFFYAYGNSGYEKLSEDKKIEQTIRTKSVIIDLKKRLKTPKGGVIRKKEKISRIVDEAIVDLRKEFENKKQELINEMIEEFNNKLESLVKNNNMEYERDIIPIFTNRETLDDILELNKELDDVSKLKEQHDIENGKIDAEISVYAKKIEELQNKKSNNYKKTVGELFKDDYDKLSPELKKKIDEGKSFGKPRGISFK